MEENNHLYGEFLYVWLLTNLQNFLGNFIFQW